MRAFEIEHTQEMEVTAKSERNAIEQRYEEKWRMYWPKSDGFKKRESYQIWIKRKLAADEDLTKELKAHVDKFKSKTDLENELTTQYTEGYASSKSKEKGQSKEDYVKRKVAVALPAELEKRDLPDLTLMDAVKRSNKFLSALPEKIKQINEHGNSPDDIKKSFKIYYTLVHDVEDETWTKNVGTGTYFNTRVKKEDTGDEKDKHKKIATKVDFANCAQLMEDRVAIFSLLKGIQDELIGGEIQNKQLKIEDANKLSNQFLPVSIRRDFKTKEDRIVFSAWSQLMRDFVVGKKEKEEEGVEKHADKASLGGTVSDAVSGNASNLSTVGINGVQDSSKSIYEGNNKNAAFEHFSTDTRWTNIVGGIGQGFTGAGEILTLLKEFKSEEKEHSISDISVKVANVLAHIDALIGSAMSLLGFGFPIIGTAIAILQSLLKGIKFILRYVDENSLDEEEEKKTQSEQSGLLGALKRTSKRSMVLSIYSGVDLISSTFKLFAEIFSASLIVSAVLGGIAAILSVGKTLVNVIENSINADAQQEAKKAVELNTTGAAENVLKESDDFAVTAIIQEAKAALASGNKKHISVRKLAAYGITEEYIKKDNVGTLRAIFMKELDRTERSQTLLQSAKFWDKSNENSI